MNSFSDMWSKRYERIMKEMLTQTNWGKITTDIHNPWEKVEVMFFALGHRGLHNMESFTSLYPIEISRSKTNEMSCFSKSHPLLCREKLLSLITFPILFFNIWVFHVKQYGRSISLIFLFLQIIGFLAQVHQLYWYLSLTSKNPKKITINIWQPWQILPDCLLW